MRKMKSLVTVALASALSLTLCHFGAVRLANAAEGTGDKNVYFQVNTDAEKPYMVGTEEEFNATHGGMGTMIHGGGNSANNIVRKVGETQYLDYQFNLDDTITATVLKVTGQVAKDAAGVVEVSYSVDGGATYTPLSIKGASYHVGTYYFDLNGENALSNENNTFRIRLKPTESPKPEEKNSIGLYSIWIGNNFTPITADSVTIENMSQEYSTYAVDSTNTYVWLDNNVNPLYFILGGGGFTTFGFDLPDDWTNAKLSITGSDAAAMVASYSADGATWEELPEEWNGFLGTKLKDNAENKFYLKLSAGASNAIINSIKIEKSTEPVIGGDPEPEKPVPGKGDNVLTIAENVKEAYFAVGTTAESDYKFASADIAFDETHKGMAVDDANGGWAANTPANARKLNNGDCLVYEFDMQDAPATGVLKLYGSAGLTVEYSVDNGETYTALAASFKPYQLGYHAYPLTAADALSAENNKFRVKITSTATPMFLDEVYVCVGEAAPVSQSVYLATHSEDFIRYLVDGADNYTYISYAKTPMVFFVGAEKSITFKMDLAEGTSVETILATLVKNGEHDVKLQVSKDGTDYVDLFTSAGGGGTPPSQSANVSQTLAGAGTVYIKALSLTHQSFLNRITVGIAAKEVTTDSFDVYTAKEGNYALENNGGLYQYTDQETVPFIGLANGESVTYKFDFKDDTTRAQFSFAISGAYRIAMSADGTAYEDVKSSSANNVYTDPQTVNVYDVFKNNQTKTVYVKIFGAAQEGATFLRSISFTTENVPPKPIEDFDDVDDDLEFDYTVSGTPDNFPKPEVVKDPEPVVTDEGNSQKGCASQTGTLAGAGVCAIALAAVLATILLKKKEQK